MRDLAEGFEDREKVMKAALQEMESNPDARVVIIDGDKVTALQSAGQLEELIDQGRIEFKEYEHLLEPYEVSSISPMRELLDRAVAPLRDARTRPGLPPDIKTSETPSMPALRRAARHAASQTRYANAEKTRRAKKTDRKRRKASKRRNR